MEIGEDGKASGGSRSKAANYYMFVNRLKEKVENLPKDVNGLQELVRRKEEEAHQLANLLATSEQSARLLQQQATTLQGENESLKKSQDQANAEINRLQSTNLILSESKAQLEVEIAAQRAELLQRLGAAERATQEALADRAKLEADAAAARLEAEALAHRLRDVDGILSSRLSLLTDVFAVYKKVDALGKRLKGTPEATTLVGEFKGVVGRHYSDDELAHLGSSRHFFPQLESPTRSGTPKP
jgi:chromosome segregation ATPase